MGLKEDIKQRPLASAKWAEIKDYGAIHVHGKPPTRIFKTRRPLESTNEYALEYRIQNWQPITKQSFHLAISTIIETANHVHVGVQNLEDSTVEYIDDIVIRAAGKKFTHESYIIDFVGRMAEYDPNGVLVHIPKHPNEPLIPDYREEIPNFNNVTNQTIDLDIMAVSSDDIYHLTEDELWIYGGEWLYKTEKGKDFYEPYFWMLTAEATRLLVPRANSKEIYTYEIVDYYANDLENVPFDVIGYNSIVEDIDGEWVEFQEPTYSGAVAIGNKLLGIDSDNDIIQTRFTYPEKFQHVQTCAYPGCTPMDDPQSPYNGLFVNTVYDSENDCSSTTACVSCGGKGFVLPDTSPLGTHMISKSDLFDGEGKFVPPMAYIHPDLGAPKHMSEQVDKLFDRMCESLFVLKQNTTNQSGESKGYDVRQKVTVVTGAVHNIYSVYQNSLNTIQGFLRGAEDVVLLLPPDMNVKTAQDITMELASSKDTSSLYTSNLTKNLVLKTFGNTPENRKAVDFLELHDLLFGMTADEVLKTVISYPAANRARMQAIHDKGWAVLLKLAMAEDFMIITDEELKTRFDAQIDVIAPPPPVPTSPIA